MKKEYLGLTLAQKQKAYRKAFRKRHPNYLRDYARTIPAAKKRFDAHKHSALKYGGTFLTSETHEIFISQSCVYCGTTPANGIDRVNNRKGYTSENSVPCCKICNRAKMDLTKKEFLDHVRKINSYQIEKMC